VPRPFTDPSSPPAEEAVRQALGRTSVPYEQLLEQAAGFARDWTFSKSGGWMLKVHRRGKALFYVIPLDGCFRLSMAIREAERDTLSVDPAVATLHDDLAAARRFTEGFAVAFDVTAETDPRPIHAFVDRLIELRA
jgi:Protein of unknown function (DUF3788)